MKRRTILMAVIGTMALSMSFPTYAAGIKEGTSVGSMVPARGIIQPAVGASFSGAYLGTWWDLQSTRCNLDIVALGDDQFLVTIRWSSGANSGSEWKMTARYDQATGFLVYQDGRKVFYEYNDLGARQDQTVYEDGTGSFYLADGYLYWVDNKEHEGDTCYFEKDNSSPAEAEGYDGTTLYVVGCDISITLRNAPSTDAAEITQIPVCSAVTFIDSLENGFSRISYYGQSGYVLSAYLDAYEPQVYTGVTCKVVNCRQSITLRTSASSNAREICQIPLGTTVDYIDSVANGFYLINYNGNMGYAKADYMAFQ